MRKFNSISVNICYPIAKQDAGRRKNVYFYLYEWYRFHILGLIYEKTGYQMELIETITK